MGRDTATKQLFPTQGEISIHVVANYKISLQIPSDHWQVFEHRYQINHTSRFSSTVVFATVRALSIVKLLYAWLKVILHKIWFDENVLKFLITNQRNTGHTTDMFGLAYYCQVVVKEKGSWCLSDIYSKLIPYSRLFSKWEI